MGHTSHVGDRVSTYPVIRVIGGDDRLRSAPTEQELEGIENDSLDAIASGRNQLRGGPHEPAIARSARVHSCRV